MTKATVLNSHGSESSTGDHVQHWVACIAIGGEGALRQLLDAIMNSREEYEGLRKDPDWEPGPFQAQLRRDLDAVYRTRFRQLLSPYSFPKATTSQMISFSEHLNLVASIASLFLGSAFEAKLKFLEGLMNDAVDEMRENEKRVAEGKEELWIDLSTGKHGSRPHARCVVGERPLHIGP